MLRSRHREWLALTTFVVVVGACELNPQPDLPNNDSSGPSVSGQGGSLSLGMGGTSSQPPLGLGDAGEADSGGLPGQIPEVNGGQGGADAASGQDGGESGGQAGQSAAGQAGAGGDAP